MAIRLAPIEVAQQYVTAERPENVSLLGRLLDAASAVVIRRSSRNFKVEPALVNTGTVQAPVWVDSAAAVAKVLPVRNGSVRLPDLRAVTSVAFEGFTLTADDYELTTVGGDDLPFIWMDFVPGAPAYDVVRSPYRTLRPKVTITGRWGIWPIPDLVPDVEYAVCAIAARMFSKKDARWADTVQAGLESAAFTYYKELPADVQGVIESLRPRKVALV